MSDVLKNLVEAVRSKDEDEIAMALKLAELAGDSSAPAVPSGQIWFVQDTGADNYQGPFADEVTAQTHADAIDAAGGDAYVFQMVAPVAVLQQQPGAATAPNQPAIQYDQASGKYVTVGQTIANKPAGSLYSSNP